MTALINASTSSGVVITPDNSGSLDLQSNGTTKFSVTSAGAYGQLVSATAQASTSGTSIDFTGIPSWVKRVTVMFQGFSTNGSSNTIIQLGTSGGVTTSGYLGSSTINGSGSTTNNFTTGFGIRAFDAAGLVGHGAIQIQNLTSNTWVASGTVGRSDSAFCGYTGGSISLGGTLDRVRITTVNGTDTFDAGSINIMYEG
jgi:hypothetical protein